MAKTFGEFKLRHNPEVRIKQLEKELKKATAQSADAALMKEAVGTLDLQLDRAKTPTWALAPLAKPSSPGVPTLFISDLHWGEVVHPSQIGGVNKFNLAIARERMRYTIETAIHLLRILDPKMDYPGIVVPLGGDNVTGDIHEELTATNELATIPTMLDLYEQLVSAIGLLATTFGRVFLPCVTGNHGRNTKQIWMKDRHHTSFDWLLYQFLARHFARDKRVTFFIPDGNDALFRIYSTRYLLTHGDRLGRGGDGIIGMLGPVMRGDSKKRSRNAQIDRAYDTLICGHFHQYTHTTRVIVNGSMKGMDEYAYIENFPFEPPQQALWITHPRHGQTFRMPVYCEAGSATKKTTWVSAAKS